ncbi:MAG: tetratricopeptide repeat protein [Sumerlaeia bacterium]
MFGRKKFEDLYEDAVEAYQEGDLDEATRLCEKALDAAGSAKSNPDSARGEALNLLAGIYRHQDRLEEAREAMLEALPLLEKDRGEDDVDFAGAVQNAGDLCLQTGDLARARTLLQKALALKAKVAGEDHEVLWLPYASLATLEEEEGNDGKAAELFAKALKAAAHDGSGDTLASLVEKRVEELIGMGRGEDAAEFAEKGQALLREVFEQDITPYTEAEVKTWVFDFQLAQMVRRCTMYQESGILPHPLVQVMQARASALTAAERYAGAVAVFEEVDAAAQRGRRLSGPEARYPEDMHLDSLARREFDAANPLAPEPDTKEAAMMSLDGNAEDPKLLIDRAQFQYRFALALHFLGQQTKDAAALRRAEERYLWAEPMFQQIVPPHHPFFQEWNANLAEVREDLAAMG